MSKTLAKFLLYFTILSLTQVFHILTASAIIFVKLLHVLHARSTRGSRVLVGHLSPSFPLIYERILHSGEVQSSTNINNPRRHKLVMNVLIWPWTSVWVYHELLIRFVIRGFMVRYPFKYNPGHKYFRQEQEIFCSMQNSHFEDTCYFSYIASSCDTSLCLSNITSARIPRCRAYKHLFIH